MRLGIDAQFAAGSIRAGLFVHHYQLLRALLAASPDIEVTLFLNAWSIPAEKHEETRARVSQAFGGLPTHVVTATGRLARLRIRLSKLGGLDVFYHVFGGTFEPIPGTANVFLIPDLIPLVVDYPLEGFREHALAYYRRAVEYGDAIIVYSEHTKADLVRELKASPGRIIVTPLAAGAEFHPIVDATMVHAELARMGLGSTPYVLAVGTLEKRKNLELLVRAFARLKRAHPTLSHRLVLCGSKWVGHESVFATIAAEAIGDAVVYLGHAERLDVLYNGASVFVFPSKYEGFGLPPLEAMACGVPVIVSNATSLPEVVGDAALLFEPDSVDGLAEAIGRVLYDPALAAELKLAGVRRAAQFTWEATAVATRKAFDRALGLH